jgi:RNA polymerase sigma-32 factor
MTLEELSTEFGVSRERVRQIEMRAFGKVQAAVKKNLAAIERPRAPMSQSRGYESREAAMRDYPLPVAGV